MGRLKGGKVFIDLSKEALSNEPSIELMQEEIDVILSKGIVNVKIKDSLTGLYLVVPTHINGVDNVDDETIIQFGKYSDSYNESNYAFELNLSSKLFYITLL